MGKWYVERYRATRVYIECPACHTGIIRFARDPIPDACPVCGSENEGGGYLNIKEGGKICEQ